MFAADMACMLVTFIPETDSARVEPSTHFMVNRLLMPGVELLLQASFGRDDSNASGAAEFDATTDGGDTADQVRI